MPARDLCLTISTCSPKTPNKPRASNVRKEFESLTSPIQAANAHVAMLLQERAKHAATEVAFAFLHMLD